MRSLVLPRVEFEETLTLADPVDEIPAANITYDRIESVAFHTDSGADVFQIAGVSLDTTFSVNAGPDRTR